jgi:hypothetical protein
MADLNAIQEPNFGTIYPNPTTGNTVIPVSSTQNITGRIDLIDATGRSIAIIHEGAINKGNSSFQLDASKVLPGVYFVRMQHNGRCITQKLIVR